MCSQPQKVYVNKTKGHTYPWYSCFTATPTSIYLFSCGTLHFLFLYPNLFLQIRPHTDVFLYSRYAVFTSPPWFFFSTLTPEGLIFLSNSRASIRKTSLFVQYVLLHYIPTYAINRYIMHKTWLLMGSSARLLKDVTFNVSNVFFPQLSIITEDKIRQMVHHFRYCALILPTLHPHSWPRAVYRQIN